MPPILHYLDDFLIIGPPPSNTCLQHLNHLKQACHTLGVPLTLEKVEGPSTVLTFLGILLDTHQMEVRSPEEKLQWLRTTVTEWVGRKNVTKREILSLVGQLQHAGKVVRYSCMAELLSLGCTLQQVRSKNLTFIRGITNPFKSYLYWWHTFLKDWNEISFLKLTDSALLAHAVIKTDASGSRGCGAFFNNKWFQWKWPQEWQPVNILAKEMAPILLSCGVWGPLLV